MKKQILFAVPAAIALIVLAPMLLIGFLFSSPHYQTEIKKCLQKGLKGGIMKEPLCIAVVIIALFALTPMFVLGEMTSKEFGDTGNRFIARETGVGDILTSFTATMDIEILSIYLHTSGVPTGGEFNAIVDSATSTTYDYTYINYEMEDLTTTGTTMVWPTSTDANHYYLEKENHVDMLWTNPSTSMVWGLELYYERR